ncbi:hypothetical protein Cni_G01841 [Canna indica]|uniref:Serine/threonine-protein kinase PRP4 homolog n=1 Tax=Canna indica TaxID=4628 RepID=A0AAQ3JPX5_9LILI|nr:hypothetical protein Cni_G01841 [Canna indica]
MASEELSSPTTSSKHRRSSDDHGVEASSKRRKHHHHHHHRRRHRHRSRHGRESDYVVEETPPATHVAADSSVDLMPVDDEREEGEILEEDEEKANINGGEVDGFKFGRGSDIESGELKGAGFNIMHEKTDNIADNQNAETDEKMLDPVQSCEHSTFKDRASMEMVMLDRDTSTENIENMSQSISGKGIVHQEETIGRQSKSSVLNEKKHIHIDIDDSKIQERSTSPVYKESSDKVNHRKKDFENRDSDSDTEMLNSRQHLESKDADRRASDSNRSISPTRDKSKGTRRSPSSNRCYDEDRHRDRSRSRIHTKRHSYEKVSQPSSNGEDRVDSQGNIREDSSRYHRVDDYAHYAPRNRDRELHSERESSGSRMHDDRHGNREKDRERERNNSNVRDRDNMDLDKGARRERERSSSYSRYDSREDRHGSRRRDRERERNSSSLRDRENVDLHRGARMERESSSYSKYDRREDRHEIRDRERGRERYSGRDRVREKSSDIRDSYVERERLRDDRHERERNVNDRDKNRARDRDANVHKGRTQGGQLEIDRNSSWDRHAESRHSKRDEVGHHKDKSRSKEAGSYMDNAEEEKQKSIREEEEEDYQEKIEQQLAKQDEEDVDKIKEESRKRRQAILEKYRQQQLQKAEPSSDGNANEMEKATSDKEKLQGLQASNADIKGNGKFENVHDSGDAYDVDPSFTVGKSPLQTADSANKTMKSVAGLGEGTPKSERSADMFSDDIFGESPAGVCKTGKGEGPQIDKSSLYDNWDDAEGYYSYRFGEVLDGRYEVIAAHGKGVFSTVVRAKDLKAGKGDPEEVAIKIIRNNETMYKAGQDELVILKKLAGADPEDKRHCVRFLSSFKYRNHLCLVFESLHMNLREVLKKFGRNIGLKLTAVRAYAKQLFIALKHLRNCGVLHCDIKPDNMLVNEAKNVLKLCDFGNAMFAGKNEITPYLVSRFYRAPEIILGLPYDHPMDIWSVGCCLYELYTGKVLFPGPSNNDMLRLQMELKGSFPKKMLRKGAFTDQHFDQDLNFHATEEDPVTKKPIKRLLLNIKPKDIGVLISSFPGEDPKLLSNFKDLLDRIFVLDPEKRMTVSQALSHPFITGK